MKSETIVVSAPFSFNGSALRIWKITNTHNQLLKWLILVPVALMLITCAWMVVLCWYLLFGIFLVPYRLIRRSWRKQKRDKLRHQEVLDAIERRKR